LQFAWSSGAVIAMDIKSRLNKWNKVIFI
jgi:hypothetical protein